LITKKFLKNSFSCIQFVFLDPPVQPNMILDVVVQPEMFLVFEELAENFKIKFEITLDDLQRFETLRICYQVLSF
jgi:Carboxypeptidase activation peptide